jgi:U3 small nucleolar RNA-associated protein 14
MIEIQQRQAKIAKMKSLMFHLELKLKRQNKIRSKTYRKIKKKQKQKLKDGLEEAEAADPELAAERAQRDEIKRAELRMGLQHKAGGKWAKQMQRRIKGGTTLEATKAEMAEQHRNAEVMNIAT